MYQNTLIISWGGGEERERERAERKQEEGKKGDQNRGNKRAKKGKLNIGTEKEG